MSFPTLDLRPRASIPDGSNRAGFRIPNGEVELVYGDDQPFVVARFSVEEQRGTYSFVSDAHVLSELLARMLVAIVKDTPMAPADPRPGARIGRSGVLDTVGRRRRELIDRIALALLGQDQDMQTAWTPQSLGDDRDSIVNYGGHPPLDTAEAMRRLRLSRQGLAARRKSRTLLGLPLGPREIVYPAWQFDWRRSDHLVPGLRDVLRVAPQDDPWGTADKLTSPQPSIDEDTPIDVLRAGRVAPDVVAEIAALIQEDDD